MLALEDLIDDLHCPMCGQFNTFIIEEGDLAVQVGTDRVIVTVRAGICRSCGEQAYDQHASATIDAAVTALRAGDVTQLRRKGDGYRFVADPAGDRCEGGR